MARLFFQLVILLYVILYRNSLRVSRILCRYPEIGALRGHRNLETLPQLVLFSWCEDVQAVSQIFNDFTVNGTQHLVLSNGDNKDNEEKTEERVEDSRQDQKVEQEEKKVEQEEQAVQQDEQKMEQEEQKVDREPEEVEQPVRRRSRIETYDEFARFRDSSRPPDSHYPPGLVGGFKRSQSSVRSGSMVLTCGVTGGLAALLYG